VALSELRAVRARIQFALHSLPGPSTLRYRPGNRAVEARTCRNLRLC